MLLFKGPTKVNLYILAYCINEPLLWGEKLECRAREELCRGEVISLYSFIFNVRYDFCSEFLGQILE